MSTTTHGIHRALVHPVSVEVEPQLRQRDRLTTAFRLILALPHLILVGGPVAFSLSWGWAAPSARGQWSGGGVLGAAAGVCAMIAWFAILFTGRYPDGLRRLAELYLRWRVRAVSYTALLRDDYPPFGDTAYPAVVRIAPSDAPRDRLTVAFRIILVVPHLIAVWVLGLGWAVTTLVAWFSILLTGSYPSGLYDYGVGVLRWSTRLEAYLLLLHDEYPPFSLE